MKTYYAITDGDYSDYHIIAITDNKDPLGIAVSIMAGIAFIAFIVMCE